jgi:hypothetical protein
MLSTKQAAHELGVSVQTLRGHARDENISVVIAGRGKKRPAFPLKKPRSNASGVIGVNEHGYWQASRCRYAHRAGKANFVVKLSIGLRPTP